VVALIPVVSGLVGWGTNYLAIQMTFYPLEFKPWKVWQLEGSPFGLFGWQGIIPAKARKMTTTITLMCRDKLIDMKEVFARLDPDVLAELMAPEMRKASARALDESLTRELPRAWVPLPSLVKEQVVTYATRDAAQFVRLMVREVGERLDDVFDILHLTVNKTDKNKGIIVHMFQETGAREFKFLVSSGLYFGLLLGVPQMVTYLYYQGDWVLPVAGFVVGYLTNFLALLLIFSPVRPWVLFGGRVRVQGVFLKRQAEASARLAALSAHYFFRPADVWGEILHGGRQEAMARLLEDVTAAFMERHVRATVGGWAGAQALGPEAWARVRETSARVIREALPDMLPLGYEYMEQAMGAEETLRQGLQELPPEEFEGVLHPVFKEDEIKLILVGGFLGAIAGGLQVLLYRFV